MNIKTVIFLASVSVAAASAGACSPVGLAVGAGATAGIAAQQEGGIRAAADDVRIKAMIGDKWFKYKVDTFSKLSTTVDQGRVLITGVVQNPDDRVEAVRLAWQVDGVKQVINEIRVAEGEGLPGFVRDKWITTRLRTQLTFEKNVSAINYSIDTVQGTVYLMGVARNQAELNHVIGMARTIPNVKEVVSYVKPLGEPVQGQAAWTTPQAPAGTSVAAPVAVPVEAPVAAGAPAALSTPVERTPLSP